MAHMLLVPYSDTEAALRGTVQLLCVLGITFDHARMRCPHGFGATRVATSMVVLMSCSTNTNGGNCFRRVFYLVTTHYFKNLDAFVLIFT